MTNMTPEYILSQDEHDKMFKDCGRHKRGYERLLHKLLVDGMYQCSQGNSARIIRVLTGLTGTAKPRDIAAWAKHFSGDKLLINGSKVTFVKGWKETDFNLPEANGTPFWTFKPEPTKADPLNMDGLLDWLAKRNGTGKVDVTPEVAEVVKKLHAEVYAIKMEAAGWVRKDAA